MGAQMFNEGWDVALVDLRRVCAFQPLVNSEQAIERVASIDGTDMVALATLTLPFGSPTQLPVQLDQNHQTWIISSPNMNLPVLGAATPNPGQPGLPVFGFGIGVSESFLQVGEYRDRYYLRDGYHRSYGLLRQGISVRAKHHGLRGVVARPSHDASAGHVQRTSPPNAAGLPR
jgi:hypothetical protein